MPGSVIPSYPKGNRFHIGNYLWAVFLISAVVILAYHPILDCFFTGTDALTLIETSRINSLGDIPRIFTTPLMDGTEFTKIATFYRPVSVLTYSVDHFLWGLNPFGFHLTNLLLHISVGFLIFVLLTKLGQGDCVLAGLAAGIFVLHPILAESVPAIDRRHDLIASLFLLLTLIFFIGHIAHDRHKRIRLGFSLTCYCLALGSKEIAIVSPLILWLYLVLFLDEESRNKRILAALRLMGPFLIATLVYLIIRSTVLGGLGGYQVRPQGEWPQMLAYMTNIICSYFVDLWYPVDFLNVTETRSVYTSVLALVLFSFLYGTLSFSLARQPMEDGQHSIYSRLIVFLMLWCILPLGLFLGTLTFGHRNMYMPAIPFSGMLALAFVFSVKGLRERIGLPRNGIASRTLFSFLGLRTLMLLMTLAVVVSLIAYSPACRRYGQWEDSARISKLFLENVQDAVNTIPKTIVIHVRNLPEGINSYRRRIPHAKEVTYLRDYSIKSQLSHLA